MNDTLQKIAQTAKQIVLWIIAPLAVIAGIIMYLLSKNKALQEDNAVLESKKDSVKEEVQDEQVTQQADDAVSDYEQLKAQYDKSRPASDKKRT